MKQTDYIIRGFLLLLVLVIVTWVINILLNIKPAPSKQNDHEFASEQTKPGNEAGKKLFMENCASCHAVNKDLTGPALAGVEKRVTDKKLLYSWVRNPPGILGSGNKYFNDLKKRVGGVIMTPFPTLTDQDIDNILEYVKQSSGAHPVRSASATVAEVKP